MKIGHVLGKWCLWTYEAEPAPPGKASFGELSVSIIIIIIYVWLTDCVTQVTQSDASRTSDSSLQVRVVGK